LHSPVLTPVPEFTLLSGCQPERSRPNPALKGKQRWKKPNHFSKKPKNYTIGSQLANMMG
jgi:hypothetical protein